jgi:hypothetical protein
MYLAITLNYFAAKIRIIYRNYAVIISFFHRKEQGYCDVQGEGKKVFSLQVSPKDFYSISG